MYLVSVDRWDEERSRQYYAIQESTNRLLRISSGEHFKSWHYHHAIPRNCCNDPLSELS